MLRLEDSWVWDFWLADDGRTYHIYFLKAPRSLGDPDLRHFNVAIGHAISHDLIRWGEAADILVPATGSAFDDIATWTGSVVRGPDDTWFMFYTGCTDSGSGLKQRIGLATSADLYTWHKHAASPVLESDRRWYEQLGPQGHDEAWRDPWVFPDPAGDGWHMLVTARASHGAAGQRGVLGHARSRDLVRWQAQPPLSRPDTGFWHLEVPQVEVVAGRPVLMFSCMPEQLSAPAPCGQRSGGNLVRARRLRARPVRCQKRRAGDRRGSVQRAPDPRPGRAVAHARVPQPGATRRLRRGDQQPHAGELGRARHPPDSRARAFAYHSRMRFRREPCGK